MSGARRTGWTPRRALVTVWPRGGRVRAAALGALAAAACAGAGPDPGPELTELAQVAPKGGSQPTVDVGESGEVLTAWVGEDRNVWLHASGRPGLVRVNDVEGDAAPHAQAPAQVVAGRGGAVYVVWHNETPVEGRRFPASDLRLARSSDGGWTFEPAIAVNDDAGGAPASHTFQDLVIAHDGALVVSWIDSRTRVTDAPHHGGHGAGGDPGAGRRGPQIRVARSTDGGRTFGASSVVSVDACPCCRTALATGPDGAIYLAWRQVFDGGIRDIVLARSDDGGATFGPPVRVHEDGWVFDGCPHAGPSLGVGPDGVVHVAWYTGREGDAGLFYTASRDGGRSFAAPTAVLSADWVPPSTTRVSVTDGGEVWLAYEDKRPDVPVVRLARVGPRGQMLRADREIPGVAPDMPPSSGERPVLALLGASGGAVLATGGEAAPAR